MATNVVYFVPFFCNLWITRLHLVLLSLPLNKIQDHQHKPAFAEATSTQSAYTLLWNPNGEGLTSYPNDHDSGDILVIEDSDLTDISFVT